MTLESEVSRPSETLVNASRGRVLWTRVLPRLRWVALGGYKRTYLRSINIVVAMPRRRCYVVLAMPCSARLNA
jgi:hypothetical protein